VKTYIVQTRLSGLTGRDPLGPWIDWETAYDAQDALKRASRYHLIGKPARAVERIVTETIL
jgi:hypothetical protein